MCSGRDSLRVAGGRRDEVRSGAEMRSACEASQRAAPCAEGLAALADAPSILRRLLRRSKRWVDDAHRTRGLPRKAIVEHVFTDLCLSGTGSGKDRLFMVLE